MWTSFAGAGINLLVGAMCLVVYQYRNGRPWLLLIAVSHLITVISYTALALSADHPADALAHNWLYAFVVFAAQILAVSLMLLGILRLRGYEIPLSAALGFSALVLFVSGGARFFLDVRAVGGFFAGSVLVGYFAGAFIMLQQRALFAMIVGVSLLLRAIFAVLAFFLIAFTKDIDLLRSFTILNVVFIASTGYGFLLLEFDDMKRKLAEANQATAAFLANTSHEFRTPLNAIIGFASLMETEAFGPLPERYREYVGDILYSGNHMLGLVGQVLDLASIEAGGLKLRPEWLNLDHVIAETLRMVQLRAAERDSRIDYKRGDGEAVAFLDLCSLQEVLLNIVGNAVKFSPNGSVIRVILEPPVNGTFKIYVTDQGPGIFPEFMEKIFTPFWRATRTDLKDPGGIGLGLSITRRLVEAMQGQIRIDRAPGVGMTFTVTLPDGRYARRRLSFKPLLN